MFSQWPSFGSFAENTHSLGYYKMHLEWKTSVHIVKYLFSYLINKFKV